MKRNIVKTSGKVEQKRGAEIVIPVTADQLRLIIDRCDQFRVTPAEAAKCALFAHLQQTDMENWAMVLSEATEEKRTGKHPGWDACKDDMKKPVNIM